MNSFDYPSFLRGIWSQDKPDHAKTLKSLEMDNQEDFLRGSKIFKFEHTASRKLDDVDYWRHRAGWFDDDVSMKQYNSGVLSSTYSTNDDYTHKKSRSSSSGSLSYWMKDILTALGQILGAFVALAVIIMIIRFMRRSNKRNQRSKHRIRDGDGDDRSRRSKSRSRARSKSKSRKSSRTDDDYHLMADEGRSHKSGKSSRSGRSRSKSKSRSRSKSRSSHRHREGDEETGETVAVLV